jgi:aminopeptidase YwaD
MRNKIILLVMFMLIAYPVFSQDSTLSSSLRKHVDILASDSLEGRGEGTMGIIKARKYIVSEFEKAGVKPFGNNYTYDFSFKLGTIRAQSQNIIAFIEGSDPVLKNEYIVLGAHYDHVGYDIKNGNKVIFNGADDNASGTSTIIELAKLFNQNKDQLKRSIIIIAFGGEESGLLGSEEIINDNIIDPSKIKCMFSLDMVGMYSTNKGLILGGIKNIVNYEKLLTDSKAEADIDIVKMNASIENRTDTRPFGDKGIPAIYVSTGLKSPYHKPEDDSNLLDYEGMAQVCSFIYQLSLNMANSEQLKASPSLAKSGNKINFSPIIKMGVGQSFFRYSDQFYRGKSILGFNAGLAGQIKFGKYFALQPEVLYSTSGSKSANGTFRTQQVTVPVNLLVGFFNNNMQTAVYYILGGYYSYLFAGKDGHTNLDFDNTYQRNQYGLSYGVGVDVMKVQVSIVARHALTGIYSDEANEEIIEKGLYLNLGYKF